MAPEHGPAPAGGAAEDPDLSIYLSIYLSLSLSLPRSLPPSLPLSLPNDTYVYIYIYIHGEREGERVSPRGGVVRGRDRQLPARRELGVEERGLCLKIA